MTLSTVQEYVTEARRLLQDLLQPYRYSDQDLIAQLNIAMLEVRRVRPDLFAAYLRTAYPTFVALTEAVPFELAYRMAPVYYMVGKITLQDEEDTDDKRGASFMNKFQQQLLAATG